MAFIRNCIIIAVTIFCIGINAKAQTIYYPVRASQLLKATAEDAALLLQKAVAGSRFTTQGYTTMPAEGIIFVYDSSIIDNQACKVESNGYNYIKFTAAQDNGLHFGLYQYFHQLGFRFYQPGSIWEITPALSSYYIKTDTVFSSAYKYKTWFVSGGSSRWIMDNTTTYNWDSYFGENGHNLALYQRRNGMSGSMAFRGHRGDIMTGSYLATLQNNPCYVANYNGSRQANTQSVPDINNNAATALWANTIEQNYTQLKTTITSNPTVYANQYRNFDYYNKYIGIEVPDGAKWGNSKDNEVCTAADYPKESDQHFTLANITAQKILSKYADAHFQLYAYSGHADVPSSSISINKNIDIQLIATVYQTESSTNGLRNRWYNRSANVSEYQYLNLSNWSGETPSFKWSDLKASLQIAKDKKSQGIVWEASPAKFGSLPYLLAANNNLIGDISVDSSLHEFCNNLFAGAANTIYDMFQMWGDAKTAPDRYKMQLYLQQMNTAVQQTQNAPDVVKERLRELKAYLHYMVMYFNLANDDMDKTSRADKDAALCIYLAKTNKLQLVNSYYMISTIVSKYAAATDFYTKYNVTNGTAYQNGSLPLITAAEIESNFSTDLNLYGSSLNKFVMQDAAYIKAQFATANITPLAKITTKIGYTNGANYYGKTMFNIIAPTAGSFNIQYMPTFEMAGKGYINFVVESADKALQVIKDFSIDNTSAAGMITVNLPAAGKYIFTVVSKYKSSVDLTITTNGNYFYKEGAFLGSKIETYKADVASLPGYFYIPEGINKIYFTVNNSVSGNKYASAQTISNSFDFRDNFGNSVQPRFVTPKDSSLFYLDIPATAAGTFWQAATMAQYNLQFVNINNVLWYAQHKNCTSSTFNIGVVNEKGICITRLTTTAASTNLTWEVSDQGQVYKYTNSTVVDLPDYISPDAVVTLTNGGGCSFTKILKSDAGYLHAKEACASGAPVAATQTSPVLFPNPSNGIFNCSQNGSVATADEVLVYNTQGIKVGSFKNVRQFNISNAVAGLYMYQMTINGVVYKGKVVKM
jgi:hypothetical protein